MNAALDKEAISPWLIAIVVSLATFMEVLDTTITNVSLSHIAGSMGATPEESTWVLTSYLVANGIVLPLSGWLSNLMGRKRFFMLCIAGFTLASFACGAATSLPMLIVFRLLQGLAGGGLQPTQQAIILDAFPPEKRGAAFGLTGLTMIAAPIIGPTLGGLITDNFSWRWIFFINVPVGIIALMLVNRLVNDSGSARSSRATSIDGIGLSLIVLGLGALQIMLDKGQQEDWFGSTFICIVAIIAAICLVSAVVRLWRQDDPVIDLHLLKNRGFALGSMMMFFMGFALYGSSALLPLALQSQFGYDATLAGMVLSPGGLAVILLMPISGKLVGKIQARYLVAVGMALCSYGMWQTMHITAQTDYQHFVWMRVTQVLGLPFLFIPISTIAYMDIPKEKNNKASALFSMSRNMGGSIGIALMATFVSRHQQTNQAHLSEHLAPTHSVYRQTLAHYESVVGSIHGAMGKMYQELLHQSAILAYRDAFFALAVLMGTLAIVAIFAMPANRPGAGATPAAAH